MALDVTPGGSASDSYLSLADALSFANGDLGLYADGWIAATDPTREKALRRATRDIDTWIGSTTDAYSTTQALAFPRWEDVDDTGNPVIVSSIELATYHQAIYVLANAEVLDNAATRRARALSNFTEPNVSGTLAEGVGYGRLAPEAERLLTGEGFEGGAIVGFIDVH
jgi:hypothetical protein